MLYWLGFGSLDANKLTDFGQNTRRQGHCPASDNREMGIVGKEVDTGCRDCDEDIEGGVLGLMLMRLVKGFHLVLCLIV